MKTISVQTGRLAQFDRSQTLANAAGEFAGSVRSSVPAWLPVPAVPRATPAIKPKADRSAQSKQNLWLPLETESLGERLTLGLLVLAAAVGVGCGFSCLVDLVQNWSVFNHWVAQMIQ